MNFLKNFTSTIIVAIICLTLSFFWGLFHGPNAGLEAALNVLGITAILAILELSLSLDNSIVNASILKNWNAFWQKMFLTVGFLIAVVGMRLLFPIIIVAFSTGMGSVEVFQLAVNDPVKYSSILLSNYPNMAMFGGIFLWLVFSNFLFDPEREHTWIPLVENTASKVSGVPFISYLLALVLVAIGFANDLPMSAVYAGLVGILTYASIQGISALLEKFSNEESSGNVKLTSNTVKAGIGGFLYLEVLDASYSLDGVVASLSITNDIVIIMLGLAIGAMAVRCLTIYLVKQGTLDTYKYLEHGAMYAIGVLAIIMLLGSKGIHLPEIVVGSVGLILIGISLYHSIKENKQINVE